MWRQLFGQTTPGLRGGETVHRLSLHSWNSLRQVNKTSHLYSASFQSKQPLLFWCLVILKNMNLNVIPKWPLLWEQALGKSNWKSSYNHAVQSRELNLDLFRCNRMTSERTSVSQMFHASVAYTCSCVSQTCVRTRTSWLTHPRKCVCVTGVRQTNVTPSSGLGKWQTPLWTRKPFPFLSVYCSHLWHSVWRRWITYRWSECYFLHLRCGRDVSDERHHENWSVYENRIQK